MSWFDWISRFKKYDLDSVSVFKSIYLTGAWKGKESASGRGSDLDQTQLLRTMLPTLFSKLDVRSILDLPCGDFHWMREVMETAADIHYIGGDIIEDLVTSNNSKYRNDRIAFQIVNLTSDSLPAADLIFCRDCLVHLSFSDIQLALDNILGSSFSYVALTTFTGRKRNKDIRTGRWRPLNLQQAPFNFPSPIVLIEERCTEENGRFSDKALAIWHLEDLRK